MKPPKIIPAKRPSCPECCKFPHISDWPKLKEQQGRYRQCPVCDQWFNENLQVLKDSKDKPLKNPFNYSPPKKEIQDPSNPGEYMTALEDFREMSEESKLNWIRYYLNKWPSWDINYVIYKLAVQFDIRPGLIRAEIDLNKEKFYYLK